MSKAIGGYVRRSERRYVPPAPDDGISRCGYCRARLDLGMWPHICKELTFGPPPPHFEQFGQVMHSLLGAPERPGPPYIHTFRPPEPEYDDEGNEIWRPLDPAYTLTEGE